MPIDPDRAAMCRQVSPSCKRFALIHVHSSYRSGDIDLGAALEQHLSTINCFGTCERSGKMQSGLAEMSAFNMNISTVTEQRLNHHRLARLHGHVQRRVIVLNEVGDVQDSNCHANQRTMYLRAHVDRSALGNEHFDDVAEAGGSCSV